MNKHKLFWLAVVVTLIGSLLAVPVVTGAQEPLTETYVDPTYGYTVSYPAGWELRDGGSAGNIQITPPGMFNDNNNGPAVVILVQTNLRTTDLDLVMYQLVTSQPGIFSPVQTGTRDGQPMRSVSYTNNENNPHLNGLAMLVLLPDDNLLAVGYFAPSATYDQWEPTFEAIRASVRLDANSAGPASAAPGTITSSSAASVQLEQLVPWEEAGLTFALPADWDFEFTKNDQIDAWSTDPTDDLRTISLLLVERDPFYSLQDIMDEVLRHENVRADVVDTTLAGYPAIAAEYVSEVDNPALHIRLVLADVAEHDTLVLFFLSANESDWANFRPIASAFTSNVAPIEGLISQILPSDTSGTTTLIAAPASGLGSRPRQGSGLQPYLWEEMGIMFEIPADWQGFPGSQDYDLALVSPEAAQGGAGTYMTFSSIPYLGQSFEDAMQPLADQLGTEVEAYSVAGLDGVIVRGTDEQTNTNRQLILLPYDDTDNESLYVQVSLPTDADPAVIESILASMVIAPPHPDTDAVNAAWQASLAETGHVSYGDPDAPVHVVEFLSFTCGHCANYSREIGRLIALEVEGANRISFEVAPVMWDEYATRAANAFYCAVEQGQGYSAYKALYQGYFELGYDTAYSEDGITQIMTDLGLDMDAFNTCVSEERYADTIASVETRFRDNGLTGTPTLAFGVNGEDPMPLVQPDGQVVSGRIGLATVREILSLIIDEGVSLSDIFQ